MKLIGVLSCHKEAQHRQAIRDTWAKEVKAPWEVKFFVGKTDACPSEDLEIVARIGPPGTLAMMHPSKKAIGHHLLESDDVLELDCSDTYLGTAWKGAAIRRYALEHNYDGLFLAMSDTLVIPSRLDAACSAPAIAQCFPAAASKGYPVPNVPCPHGGFGYYLSRAVMEAIKDDPVRHYSEDQNTAFALHAHRIGITNSQMFNGNYRLDYINTGAVSLHLSTKYHEFKPEDIRSAWNRVQLLLAKWPDWDGICPRCQGVLFKPELYGPKCAKCGNHFAAQRHGATAGKKSGSGHIAFGGRKSMPAKSSFLGIPRPLSSRNLPT